MKNFEAIVSEKGQVTIPKPLRDQLGLKEGEVIEFRGKNGELIARKKMSRDPLDEVTGLLKGKAKDTDSYLEEIRGSSLKP